MTPDNSHNREVALRYAVGGTPIIPCAASGAWIKGPLTQNGHHDATTDEDRIKDWWHRYPFALVGIPSGPPSALWILDVDGDQGRQSLNSLLSRLGLERIEDLTRVVSRTPSGGLHLFFQFEPGTTPRNRAGDIGMGLDTRGVRADGSSAGYFIAPGTVLTDGRRYAFINPHELDTTGGAN
jgi:hypothetical protein